MRHILVIIALIVTAWAFLPGAAQAHEMPHAAMALDGKDGSCADCAGMNAGTGHLTNAGCHHSAACGPAAHVLPVTFAFAVTRPVTARSTRPDDAVLLRSITLSRDLPPPRS